MPRPWSLGLCCALALAAPAPAWAADPPPAPAPGPASTPADEHDKLVQSFREEVKADRRPEEEESFSVKSVLWMFAAMGFVIAAIYITLNFGLRRLMGARAVGSAQLVSVVERVVLDQRKSILVLRAAGEYMLVGASEGGIHLICKLDAQEVERLGREARIQQPGISPFLQKLLSRKGGPPPPQA
jgi:flagellar protein FliO/FliZ